MPRMAKVKHIGLLGRRWFNRRVGQSYNTVTIYVNGKAVTHLPENGGGDDMYEQRAMRWLITNGYIPADEKNTKQGGFISLWRAAERDRFDYTSDVVDVPRQKDLLSA